VEKLVGRGCAEVRLAAQDIGIYGQDLGADLPGLLLRLSGLDGDFRLRVGMMNPESLLPIMGRLMDSFKHPKVFKFLHVRSRAEMTVCSAGWGAATPPAI